MMVPDAEEHIVIDRKKTVKKRNAVSQQISKNEGVYRGMVVV